MTNNIDDQKSIIAGIKSQLQKDPKDKRLIHILTLENDVLTSMRRLKNG